MDVNPKAEENGIEPDQRGKPSGLPSLMVRCQEGNMRMDDVAKPWSFSPRPTARAIPGVFSDDDPLEK